MIFPSFLRPAARGLAGTDLHSDNDACCFYHDGKLAVSACENCGRFLCALCDVDFAGRRLCPPCIEASRSDGQFAGLIRRRVLHDDVALAMALLPMLIPPATLFTAPAVIFYASRHWPSPGSVTRRRTHARSVIAMVLATLQAAIWIALATWWWGR